MNLEYLSAYEHSVPLVLLTPKFTPIRKIEEICYEEMPDRNTLNQLLLRLRNSRTVALDYETKGTSIYSDDFEVVGIGLAGDNVRVYLPNTSKSNWSYLHSKLAQFDNLIAHNIMFDGSVFYKQAKRHAKWKACTLAMYKQLSSEGYHNQRWGLKSAQIDVLEWHETNEVDLNDWLINQKLIKNGPKQKIKETEAAYHERYVDWVRTTDQKISVDKSKMHLAPAKILGKYCILDCESTYLLYEKHFSPLMESFPEVKEYHEGIFLHLVYILIEQYLRGMQVDVVALEAQRASLAKSIVEVSQEIREHSELGAYIAAWEQAKLNVQLEKEPTKYKKKKKISEAPKKFKKDGTESKAYLNWLRRKEEIETSAPEETKVWQNWLDKTDRIRNKEEAAYLFNLNSKMQIRKMIYGDEEVKGIITHRHKKDHIAFDMFGKGQIGLIEVLKGEKWVEVEMTKSGALPVDSMALKQMGESGALLAKYSSFAKELTYISAYKEMLNFNHGIATIHPNFMAPGTLTGRLSSRNPNVQQMPKSEGTLKCFTPRQGNVIVQVDHNALEQVVLAELSRDESMMKLYGDDAPDNDVYLFTGSYLPVIGPQIRAAGYDPENPTAEGIANAKKEAKKARGIAKVVVLASGYGAGAKKIFKTLTLNDVDISLKEVEQIHATYWEIYGGVKTYQKTLLETWRHNGGYVLNDFNQPICVDDKKQKDVLNRMCIQEGTLVRVKNEGYLPIEKITNQHQVWDGIEWVSCEGRILKGHKEVVNVLGTYMTPDHKVLVNGEMKENQNVRVEDIEAGISVGFTWREVWRLGSCFISEVAKAGKNLYRSKMSARNKKS